MVIKVRELNDVKSLEDMLNFVEKLRIESSNNRNNDEILSLVDRAIQKCELIDDQKSLVKLYEIKISQIQHSEENFTVVTGLIRKMKAISQKINYVGGLALAYNVEWYIEKYKGNKQRSKSAIEKSMKFIALNNNIEEYDYYTCYYSFGVEKWLLDHDEKASCILEECVYYFMNNGFYRSLTFALGVLLIIYQQNQNKEKMIDLTKKILGRRGFLEGIPEEIKSNIHFFIGFSQELSFNLNIAEEHLKKTASILKPIYKSSIYSSYYITALPYLVATFALQGKLELAYNKMIEIDELIQEGIATRNLDEFNKEQMKHIFNLTKFYILSRLQGFQSEHLQELKQNILANISKCYSNAIFFSEFLLNTELTKEQLIELQNLKNPSTLRVEHIINFLIEKTSNPDEKYLIEAISKLKNRPVEERMTTVEKAFADLLAAQEYYKLGRFSEIYPLLKKYENKLNGIEVLELRIFMEAFVQVGAFKNGDPLGPALQYMAIKKCQNYGFSRLENRLLNYLDLQSQEVRNFIH